MSRFIWIICGLAICLLTGCTTIYQGAMKGDIGAIENALARGAKVNDHYKGDCYINNMTPLMIAAYYGRTKAVEFLLDAGADTKATCTNQCDTRFAYGVNALVLGAICRRESGCGQIVRILLDRERSIDPAQNINVLRAYYWAVTDLKIESIKALLERGVDVNFRFNNGDTPLLMVIDNLSQRRNEIEFVDLLLKSGADISVKNKAGQDVWQLLSKKKKEFKGKWKAECDRCDQISRLLEHAKWRR